MNESGPGAQDPPGSASTPPPSPATGPPPSPAPASPSSAWGPLATLGLGVLVFLAFVLGQCLPIVAGVLHQGWWDPTASSEASLQNLALDGDILSASTVVGGAAGMLLIALLVRLRRRRVADYLDMTPFPWWHLPLWLIITSIAGAIQTVLAPVFQKDAIPEFMIDTYQSTDHLVLLIVGIAVMAPLFEEWFFRGFLHTGWRRAGVGAIPSILLTAGLWTLIHAQYGWFEKSWIFGFGILLSCAREWSGSLWPPIAMHAANNGVSLYLVAQALN